MMRKFLALGAAAALAVTGFAASAASAQDVPHQEDPHVAIQQRLQPKINEVLAKTIERTSGLRVDGIEVYNPGNVQLRNYSFLACSRSGGEAELLGTIVQPTRLERTALASQDGWRFDLEEGIDRRGAVVMINPRGVAVDTVDFSQGDDDVAECLAEIEQAQQVADQAPSPTASRSAQRTPDYNSFAPRPLTPTFMQIDGAPNPG